VFDPKIAVDFDKKQFKDTEYYSILNSSFKIPTWNGNRKAGFEQNEGYYLNLKTQFQRWFSISWDYL
jgi:hypothetical protein